ncbi:MAG: hypothetical protein GF329_08790 [Candidatus Lokiarchaeota archaeon]|nr:hypothetical protein [Candidatus Lokiarchaeota archaeon]
MDDSSDGKELLDLEDERDGFKQIFSDFLIEPIINLFERLRLPYIFSKIPKNFLYTISKGISNAFYGDYKDEMIRTTKKLCGDLIEKKYKDRDESYRDWVASEIVFQNGIHMTEFFLDIMTLLPYFYLFGDLDKFFKLEGIEHLNNALKQGNGVVLVSGHIGNYLFLCSYLALRGYKVNFILEYATFRGILNPLRKCGVKLIPSPRPENKEIKPRIIKLIDRAFKNNEIVVVMHDAGMKHHSLIEFFGERCHTPLGGSFLAIKHNAPIIPAFIKSCPKKHLHEIRFYPEFDLEEPIYEGDELVFYNALRLNKLLEKEIRRNIIYWNNLAIYHIRKTFRKTKIIEGRPIIENILDEFQYYKKYLEKSYELGRNDKEIHNLLDDATEKLKKLREQQDRIHSQAT